MASAGPYASLHLAPDRLPRQHLTTQFFTGLMSFLPPNQQRQSTEGQWLTVSGHFTNYLFIWVYLTLKGLAQSWLCCSNFDLKLLRVSFQFQVILVWAVMVILSLLQGIYMLCCRMLYFMLLANGRNRMIELQYLHCYVQEITRAWPLFSNVLCYFVHISNCAALNSLAHNYCHTNTIMNSLCYILVLKMETCQAQAFKRGYY